MESRIEELYEIYLAHPQISTDSRNIIKDSIFFALHGERFDGNRFAAEALGQGAAVSVIDDDTAIPDGITPEQRSKYFKVDDTLKALQDLARLHRRKLGIPLLAITGTNGKTTTKELLLAVLSQKFRTSATKGNLNNHIGVPLTLLSLTGDTEIGIIEMGASARGEIALLCGIAQPDYGIITNIGRAHLEGFGGPEGIKAAKGELYDSLCSTGGTAFVRADDPVLNSMSESRKGLRTIKYDSGLADGIPCNLAGDYNRYNIAAAAAAGRYFGVDAESIARAIGGYVPTINRSQSISTAHNTIIADCYNANPSSMQAALEWFGKTPLGELDPAARGKTIILGSMLELGEWSLTEHSRIIELAINQGFDRIMLVGSEFAEALASLTQTPPPNVKIFGDTEEVKNFIVGNPYPHRHAILLKGSRKLALEKILEYL